ncbi:MAG: NAD-dependent deacetylase [Calditrichales bacterium]|nr:MAG: NAD-dependent deacetylase [Calditrichales bacterium]
MREGDILKSARTTFIEAKNILITAGAGIGVDSGLPDFRGNEGFWRAYPPIAKLGISFTEMANPSWFDRDPGLAWAFYGHRLNLYRRIVPHNGFKRLLEHIRLNHHNYFIFTSNVDGQFQKAGFEENLIEECHGSIHAMQCSVPCSHEIWSSAATDIMIDEKRFRAMPPYPTCPLCGAIARPNILMFGDWGWLSERTQAQDNRLEAWLQRHFQTNGKNVIIEIGAGTAVPTVRYFSEDVAARFNAPLIRINPRDYLVPQGHLGISMDAEAGICEIVPA